MNLVASDTVAAAALRTLQVDNVETIGPCADLALRNFFQLNGFTPTQRLPFVHTPETTR